MTNAQQALRLPNKLRIGQTVLCQKTAPRTVKKNRRASRHPQTASTKEVQKMREYLLNKTCCTPPAWHGRPNNRMSRSYSWTRDKRQQDFANKGGKNEQQKFEAGQRFNAL
jgi:hypothetical protein